MSFFFSVLSFLQIEREREREWYIKFGYKGEIAPKLLILFFRRGSTGESFFFHGLIDFMLFLTLAWRTWVPRVQDMFLSSSPGVMAMGLSAMSPAQKLAFLLSISADGKESPLPFWDPSQSFGFSLLPPGQAIHLGYYMSPKSHSFSSRSPSTNICFSILTWVCYFGIDLHSFITVHSNGRIVLILFLSSPWDITWHLKKDWFRYQINQQ